jgi:biotin synthase
MQRDEILNWLLETHPTRLADLWRLADQTRQQYVGGQVHLRGLVELSNHCVRLCGYCGLRAGNRSLVRYRMSDDEVMGCVGEAVKFGYGTVVLQSGEDPELTCERIADLVKRIKSETPLAVTLSLGEHDEDELAAWRRAGADRYLLRFETSNRTLYERIHPPRKLQNAECVKRASAAVGGDSSRRSCGEAVETRRLDSPPIGKSRARGGPATERLAILATLRQLGYEVGSGVMIGIPGQTYDDLADDIELFSRLNLDMIGVGPYLVHPNTPLANHHDWPDAPDDRQVPASEEMSYKVIALARLVCPRANIPATTALATLNAASGRELGLVRGANVVMPNLTPHQYRALYEIYPGKACVAETGEVCHNCLTERIEALGREPGRGRGDSQNYVERLAAMPHDDTMEY